MDCKEIKNLLNKENIDENVYFSEFKDILKIYKIYSKYCDISDIDTFEQVLINNFSTRYLDWSSKINFLREKIIKPTMSKDQFSNYLSFEIEKYLKKNDENFNILDRNHKIPKSEFDRKYGYKTSASIRQSLKNIILCSSQEVKNNHENEAKFIENFCNIHKISYDWFMKKMYKNFEELNSIVDNINDLKPVIKKFGLNPKEEDNKLLSILNNSEDTIVKEIKKILNEKVYLYSDEFLIILLLNCFEKIPKHEIILELINFIEQKNINQYNYQKYIVSTKAKLLSNFGKDEEVIQILENKIYSESYKNDIELINLLAASFKRIGYKNIDDVFSEKASNFYEKALNFYEKSFELKTNYYSLINILYILKILNKRKKFDDYSKKWSDIDEESSWWYIISKLEFLMLQNDVENLKKELNNIPEIKKISKFNLKSTIRQLESYQYIENNNLKNEAFTLLFKELKKLEKNPDLGTESHLEN